MGPPLFPRDFRCGHESPGRSGREGWNPDVLGDRDHGVEENTHYEPLVDLEVAYVTDTPVDRRSVKSVVRVRVSLDRVPTPGQYWSKVGTGGVEENRFPRNTVTLQLVARILVVNSVGQSKRVGIQNSRRPHIGGRDQRTRVPVGKGVPQGWDCTVVNGNYYDIPLDGK